MKTWPPPGPARGPSAAGGIAGICMILFGSIWTVVASRTSTFFMLLGILITIIAIAVTVYHVKNK